MKPSSNQIGLWHPQISDPDRRRSSESFELLRPLVAGQDRSTVFFIGAGASSAGNSGMPFTGAILTKLISAVLDRSDGLDPAQKRHADVLGPVDLQLGFEITLNDFWQICRDSVYDVFRSLATLEARCATNRVHTFLARWISTGGIVLTTNYDQLIEREWSRLGGVTKVRYRLTGEDSFESWRDDLLHGHCLFKLHGSLDDPRSCLGALEHVRTGLNGYRAELIRTIVRERPLCFVGWQGADPDIPPLLGQLADRGGLAGPTFWVHYDGRDRKLKTLERALRGAPEALFDLTSDRPMLTEADALFGEFLRWIGEPREKNPWRGPEDVDFNAAVSRCSRSGLARFAGIVLRRAGVFSLASEALETAREHASTAGERAAAMQEIALLTSVRQGDVARVDTLRIINRAGRELEEAPDLLLALNVDFGIVSNTVLLAKKRPWLLMSLPRLFRRYRRHIDELRQTRLSDETATLHEALLNLYVGRLRLAFLGWLGAWLGFVASWILRPFDAARLEIVQAKDIHIHSTIDVLSYRALALVRVGRCDDALTDVPEIERLVSLFRDQARTRHWEEQKAELQLRCGARRVEGGDRTG